MSEDPKKSVSRESDKFMLRFPEGMRDRVATAADRNGRSMNSEILARLAYTFEKDAEDWIDGARDIVGAGKYDKIADLIIQRLNGEQLLVTRKMVKYDGPKKAVIPFRIAEEDQSPPGAEPKSTGAKRTRKPKD